MEQRRYRSTLTPEALGDLLVQDFNTERRTEAQRLGNGDSVLVQVRHGREGRQHVALTIGIARAGAEGTPAEAPGITHAADADPAPTPLAASTTKDLVVTLGEQQWFNPQDHSGSIVGSLIGALFTPWALFGLIWPLSRAAGDYLAGSSDIWGTIDNYILTQGGTLLDSTDARHPHGAEER